MNTHKFLYLIDNLLLHMTVRGVGHTHTMIHGVKENNKANIVVLVDSDNEAKRLLKQVERQINVNFSTIEDFVEYSKGIKNPLLVFDNQVIVRLFREFRNQLINYSEGISFLTNKVADLEILLRENYKDAELVLYEELERMKKNNATLREENFKLKHPPFIDSPLTDLKKNIGR